MRLLSLPIAIALLTACTTGDSAASPPEPRMDISGMLVVGNKGENTVSFIDLQSGKELARDASGPMPHEIAISPDGTQVAVVAYGGSSIDFYDAATRKRTSTLDISPNSRPHGLIWLSDGRILATTEGSTTLTVISAPDDGGKRQITGIDTGDAGHMVAVTPDYAYAYTANLGDGTISMVNLETGSLVRTAPAGAGAEGIAVTADGSEVWASARETDTVYIYDAATLDKKAEVKVGRFPLRIIRSPDGQHMVTSNLADGSVSVINVKNRQVARTIAVAKGPDSRQVTLLFSRDGTRLYAALTGPDKVAEIDFVSGKVVRLLDAGSDGDGLAIIPVR
ncbi:YncE family protein [Sphingorhabdus sp. Alg239-R122]|uniref:YncE family protein n=1 Tax=Sphingorhabdus sp. Alg239-R122 TaxID=2305989 RepID=UPI0013DD1509|nr:YncE family protein [Sphingorhabdus sp. Alg239-R122]